MNWSAVSFWGAAVLLLDAAFGLWNHERLKRLAPTVNIPRIAVFETLVALVLFAVSFWLRRGG